VPAVSRALPARVLAAALSRMCRAGLVSVLLGGAALVWVLGTLLLPTNASSAASATTPAVSASSVAVREPLAIKVVRALTAIGTPEAIDVL
jgi:hypothetical protein